MNTNTLHTDFPLSQIRSKLLNEEVSDVRKVLEYYVVTIGTDSYKLSYETARRLYHEYMGTSEIVNRKLEYIWKQVNEVSNFKIMKNPKRQQPAPQILYCEYDL